MLAERECSHVIAHRERIRSDEHIRSPSKQGLAIGLVITCHDEVSIGIQVGEMSHRVEQIASDDANDMSAKSVRRT